MPAGVSAITPLANLTLSSAQSGVTFSSISGSYRDLLIVVTAQCNTASQELTYLRLNGDTGSNYISTFFNGSSGGPLASASTASVMITNNPYFDQSNRGMAIYHIMDYSRTDKHKVVLSRADGINVTGGTAMVTNLGTSRWANTAAVTTVLVMAGFSGFAAGSTFALYGVSA